MSIVVVGFDMARELPRTLLSLSPGYQRGVDGTDYEVIVVDNGSPEPLDGDLLERFGGRLRIERIDPSMASVSPAAAANRGLELAEADLIGMWIDGARLSSPGLLHHAWLASRLGQKVVVATLGWHLGPVVHMDSAGAGYDQAAEDGLLSDIDWPSDGYRLFEISTLARSSKRGWFGPMSESNAVFLARSHWDELGGLDERFESAGGGMVNHDLYRRACDGPGAQLAVLLGEGTFHQYHGGAATSGLSDRDAMQEEYAAIRGRRYRPPANQPMYVGSLSPPALVALAESARLASELTAGA